jgi:hypothetical protein
MSGQLRSELLKIRTTRTVAVLLLALAGLTLLGVVVEGLSATVAELSTEDVQRRLIGDYGASNAALLAALTGLLLVTCEFRYGTIRPTLLFEPRRHVVLAAKFAAVALTGIVFGIVCVALSFGSGLAVLAVRGTDYEVTGTHTMVLLAGPVAASALTAILGAAIGAMVRNQVGAIVVLIVYTLVVESLIFSAAPSIGRYLPGLASSALGGMPDDHLLVPGIAGAVALLWTAVFAAGALARTSRSDI